MESFPRRPEDITAAWLSEVLGCDIEAFESEQIGIGVGLVGELYRLTLEGNGPASVVAKFPTRDEVTRQHVATPLRVYEREVGFYRDLSPKTSVGTADLYAAEFDPKTTDFVILIEDLGHLRMADQIEGVRVSDANLVIDQIAAHHVQFANSADLEAHDWLPRLDDLAMQQVVAGMVAQAIPPFLDKVGDRLSPVLRSFVETLPETVPSFMQSATEADPLTFGHVDLRLDNIFFDDPARPIVLLDWQLSSMASPAYDVAYFLSQSMTAENRQANEPAIVDRYLAALGAAGLDIDRERFDLDYRRTVAFCAVYPVNVIGQMELANDRAVDLANGILDRCLTAIDDHDALAVWPC